MEMHSPAVEFLKFYETCLAQNKFYLNDFFIQQFYYKSPVKYEVKHSCSTDELLRTICNAIFKNLHTNSFFRQLAEQELKEIDFIRLYGHLYMITKDVFNKTIGENILPKLIFLLHLSKANLPTSIFEKCFRTICSIEIVHSVIDVDEYAELEQLYRKLVCNTNIRQFSIDVIRKINGCVSIDNTFDTSKIKLVFLNCEISGLYGFAGTDSIYVSLDGIKDVYQKISRKLQTSTKMIILKLNFIRLIQHVMAHVLLRHDVDDLNISTPDFFNGKNHESGIQAEIERFGGRIDWVQSSLQADLNIKYCEEYLKKVEANQDKKFDINTARVVLDSSDICSMALDMSVENFRFE
jgi:hypothetical protein